MLRKCCLFAGMVMNIFAGALLIWLAGRLGEPYFLTNVVLFPAALFAGLGITLFLSRAKESSPWEGPIMVIFTLGFLCAMILGGGSLRVYFSGFCSAFNTQGVLRQLEALPQVLGAPTEVTASQFLAVSQAPQFHQGSFSIRAPDSMRLTGIPAKEGTAVLLLWRDLRCQFGIAVGGKGEPPGELLQYRELTPSVRCIAFK